MKTSVYKSAEKKEHFRAVYNSFLHAMPFQTRTLETPYGETFLLEAGEPSNPVVLLAFSLALGSVVYDRFFCKYLCPAGALYGAIGKASPYAVRVTESACIRCGKCSRACPMNVDIMNAKNGRVTSMGGIATAEDALKFLMAGARAVQVGTMTFANPNAMLDIIDGLAGYCARETLGNLQEIVGII